MAVNEITKVDFGSAGVISGIKLRVVLFHISMECVLLDAGVEELEDCFAFRVFSS